MSNITTDQILQITSPPPATPDGSRTISQGSERFENHLHRAAIAAEPVQAEKIDRQHNEVRSPEGEQAGGDPDAAPSDDHNTDLRSDPIDQGDPTTENRVDHETLEEGDEVTISAESANQVVDAIVDTKTVTGHVVQNGAPQLVEVTAESLPGAQGEDSLQQGPSNLSVDGELSEEVISTGRTETAAVDSAAPDQGVEILVEESASDIDNPRDHEQSSRQPAISKQTNSQIAGDATGSIANNAGGNLIAKLPTSSDAPDVQTARSTSAPIAVEPRAENGHQSASPEETNFTATSKADDAAATNPTTENVTTNADAKTQATTSVTNSAEAVAGSDRPLARLAALPDSMSADAEAERDPVPTADRARFVQRVSGALRRAGQREGQIQLRLSPPELGSLRIDIEVKQGVVTATLETETAVARNVLLDHLPALRQRLAEQEIRIEKFDVDVRRDGQGQPDNPGAEDRQSDRPQPTRSGRSGDSAEQHVAATSDVPTDSLQRSGLDVRI